MIMTDFEIKRMFSTEIIHLSDASAEMVIRTVLFRNDNQIDWQKAYAIALLFMPELKNYRP